MHVALPENLFDGCAPVRHNTQLIVSQAMISGIGDEFFSIWTADGSELTEEDGVHLYEWLSLFRLESPRLRFGDKIDPYLCRHEIEDQGAGQMEVCKVSCCGIFAAGWLQRLVADVMLICHEKTWFAMSVASFPESTEARTTELTLMRRQTRQDEFLIWRADCPFPEI